LFVAACVAVCASDLLTGNLLTRDLCAAPLERVTFKRNDKTAFVDGSLVEEAENGGVLLMAPDGLLWALQPEEILKRETLEAEFEPLDHDALGEHLLKLLGDGFKVHKTAHYVICYDTSDVYARWCGALYERLYRGFHGYWKYRGIELTEPEFPLPAIVFANRDSYNRFARRELGEAAGSTFGYYSLRANRVIMFDLTGADGPSRISSSKHIDALLSKPGAERTVATIVHEATHQIAYNCGMHQRYADVPLLVSEGMAIFFETPDLTSSRGWRTIGGVNRVRLADFRANLAKRGPDRLKLLLQDDSLFRSSDTGPAAYADAWALNYYLLKRHAKTYAEYLKMLAEKKPIDYATPEERIAEFERYFGDITAFDRQFLRTMTTLR